LSIKIKIATIFEKIFAISIIKARNLVVLTISNNLKSKENNLDIESRNCSKEKEVSLEDSKFLSFFLFYFL